MIGKMNRQIRLKSYTTTQTDGGGIDSVLADNFLQWAFCEDRSGRQFTSEGQGLYEHDLKVTFRAYPSRTITSQFYIEYEGELYKIQSLTKDKEGSVFYWVARCSKVGNN